MDTFKSLNKRRKLASGFTYTETQMSEPSSAMEGSPNWLEMPCELMENILQRLGTVEILNNAQKVCTTWRRICNDPAMWKVIDIQKPVSKLCTDYDLDLMTRHAVYLSCGDLMDISIEGFGTNKLVYYIVRCSSNLNRLCLNCCNITGSGLIRAVKRAPQLEKLHLSFISISAKDIGVIGRKCPQLKSFTMNKLFRRSPNDDHALAIANNMRELRHLQLLGNKMTNVGLLAILNGCPHLESLDVRRCFNLNLSGNLGKLCTERIKDFKRPNYSMENQFCYTKIMSFLKATYVKILNFFL